MAATSVVYSVAVPSLAEEKRQLLDRWRAEGEDEVLLRAFAAVPREKFLPESLRDQAYIDQPAVIGYEQTISQPSTVLTMLRLLAVVGPRRKASRFSILEIGAGSGYVCALLGELGCTVTGIEIVPELAVRAARTLAELGYEQHVKIHAADGGGGWESGMPYDRILVSAGAPEVPRHLFSQLKDGGILVAPVGRVEQRMIVCRKKKGGDVIEEDHGAYLFVPLTGKWGVEGESGMPHLPFV